MLPIKQKSPLIVCMTLSLVMSPQFISTFYSSSNIVFASTDIIPPSITIVKPSVNSEFPIGLVALEGAAIDDTGGSGIKTVEIRVDNGDYVAAKIVSENTSSWSITLDMQSSGSKRIIARATDNAGN